MAAKRREGDANRVYQTPKSNVNVVIKNEMEYTQKNRLALSVLKSVLSLVFFVLQL